MTRILSAALAVSLLGGCASTPDCSPPAGFSRGLDRVGPAATCGAEDYLKAHRLGRHLADLRSERDTLRNELASTADADKRRRARLNARLRVLERDIPELEALARLKNLLPPAQLEP